MGQPIIVTEKPSSIPGVIRFETNRALTGMGHERYLPGTEVWGERPPDELARRLFTQDSVAGVQINGNIVTVDLAKGYGPDGLKAIIENLYRFYPDPAPGDGPAEAAAEAPADPATPTEPAAESDLPEADAVAEATAAPEAAAEPADVTPLVADDAPAPEHLEPEPAADEVAEVAADAEPAVEPEPEAAPAEPEPEPEAAPAEAEPEADAPSA